MGIWVVILEAVAAEGEGGLGIEPGALEDLADELAANYAVVTERPGAFETELWVEEGTAGLAVLAAQRLCQAAVRFLGLPAWEVVRAEARDAHALETGRIDWPEPPDAADDVGEQEPPAPPPPELEAVAGATGASKKKAKKKVLAAADKAPARKAPAKKASARKASARKATKRG